MGGGVITITEWSQSDHWPDLWDVLRPVFEKGASYPIAPDVSEAEAKAYWLGTEKRVFIAKDNEQGLVGTYYIRENQPGLGAHVCNCGYMVAPPARGRGIARQMNQHSQVTAREMGYRAMQYNLVAATNTPAVSLWKSEGFHIVGTLPLAFAHKELGFVDAHVMFKSL